MISRYELCEKICAYQSKSAEMYDFITLKLYLEENLYFPCEYIGWWVISDRIMIEEASA